jgi:hypothetical protein
MPLSGKKTGHSCALQRERNAEGIHLQFGGMVSLRRNALFQQRVKLSVFRHHLLESQESWQRLRQPYCRLGRYQVRRRKVGLA